MNSRLVHCLFLLIFITGTGVFFGGGCEKKSDGLEFLGMLGAGSGTGTDTVSGTGTGTTTGTGTDTGTSTDPGTGTSTDTGTGTSTDTGTGDPIYNERKTDVFDCINDERTAQGLSKLLYSGELEDVAQSYAGKLMMSGRSYYYPTHGGTTPEERISEKGIDYIKAGEAGYVVASGDETHPFDGMMEGYAEVLMDPDFTHVGLGYRYANG